MGTPNIINSFAVSTSTSTPSTSATNINTPNILKMPMVKLVYFELEGRAELTRFLLRAGNIDFEDCRISLSDWPQHKANFPFGQLPVLYWDGEELAQAPAIARFVARKVGLAGQADMIFTHTEDWLRKVDAIWEAETEAARAEKEKAFMDEFLPKWLQPLEALLKKRGGEWYSGSGLTFADLGVMVMLDWLHDEAEVQGTMKFKVLDDFPLVKANYQRTPAVPEVAEWKNKRPTF